MKTFLYLVMTSIALALTACLPSVSDDDDNDDNIIVDPYHEVIELGTDTSVTLPDDVVSGVIHIFGQAEEGFVIGLSSIQDPDGNELLGSAERESFLTYTPTYGNALLPLTPDFKFSPGTWTFRTYGGVVPNQAKLFLRTGPEPHASLLDVQPYVTGTTFSAEDIAAALEILKKVYVDGGFLVNVRGTKMVDEPQYANVIPNFNDATTGALVSKGAADVINLFFVEDLFVSDSEENLSLLGIAAGIPGSLGIQGNRNGVLIGLTAHVLGDKLHNQVLGETAAHEMGHFLGLYHPTESGGDSFDPLADTPQCDISRDAVGNGGNGDGQVNPNECVGYGADNLMFWQADGTIEQTTLSPFQTYVINHSPLAK